MIARGPGLRARLGAAAVISAALGACGGDPPEAAPRGGEARSAERAAAPAREFAPAAELPSPVAASPSPVASESQVPVASPAPTASFPPSNECAKLPGFPAFRQAVFAAVAKRDAAALTALADPAVNLDFGGGSGPEEFRKRLEAGPALWGELAALESLGCAADGGVATLPWIFSRMPDSVDPFATLLVTGRGVPLRAKPAADSKELAKLDWALVETVGAPVADSAWREVTSGKTRGFVEAARLRSLLDYRLIADRQKDEWKITAFVAGD